MNNARLYFLFFLIFAINATDTNYQKQRNAATKKLYTQHISNKGYVYQDETKIPIKQTIIIFSYGSLVTQKENKKTGDLLQAGAFSKTPIQVPISFTFLAGYPLTNHWYKPVNNVKKFPLRRATATIDAQAQEYKPLWFAFSDFHSLTNARNNVAAREGAPLKCRTRGYEVSNIFYIRKVSRHQPKRSDELFIQGIANWVTLKPTRAHQKLTHEILAQMVEFAQQHNAQAAIWTALPANIGLHDLNNLVTSDPIFVINTQRYIEKFPNGNTLSSFETAIKKQYEKNRK